MTVVATLTEGYDLDYIWQQVDRGPAKDAAGYYVQAGQSGAVEGDRPDEGGKSRPSYGNCAAT